MSSFNRIPITDQCFSPETMQPTELSFSIIALDHIIYVRIQEIKKKCTKETEETNNKNEACQVICYTKKISIQYKH